VAVLKFIVVAVIPIPVLSAPQSAKKCSLMVYYAPGDYVVSALLNDFRVDGFLDLQFEGYFIEGNF
jgi:hypothetical protein